jgi:hypothetical protein
MQSPINGKGTFSCTPQHHLAGSQAHEQFSHITASHFSLLSSHFSLSHEFSSSQDISTQHTSSNLYQDSHCPFCGGFSHVTQQAQSRTYPLSHVLFTGGLSHSHLGNRVHPLKQH